ncbi:ribulose-phosphate 3-epimerase, partial [bacterium]|nr:ribulose-phosphate 3-epimerase [bacterium]
MAASRIQIAPSLLAADLCRLADEVAAVEAAGADVLHFDVMDGHFVPNLTFGFPVIEALKKITKLPIDAHLMITNADVYVDRFAAAGCNWLSVHVEACPHLHRTLGRIKELGMRAGVAINPGTP